MKIHLKFCNIKCNLYIHHLYQNYFLNIKLHILLKMILQMNQEGILNDFFLDHITFDLEVM
jgi:hypothetical protein